MTQPQPEVTTADGVYERIDAMSPRDFKHLRGILEKIAASYPDDPGTGDLYDEQPVSVSMDLGDVRLVWGLLR